MSLFQSLQSKISELEAKVASLESVASPDKIKEIVSDQCSQLNPQDIASTVQVEVGKMKAELAATTNAVASSSKQEIVDEVKKTISWADIARGSSGNGPTADPKPGVIHVPAALRCQVDQVLDDQAEAERRKDNIIIFNLPEHTGPADQVVIKERAEVKKIFDVCEVPFSPTDIESFERRGRTAPESPCPLVLRMTKDGVKKKPHIQ